MSGENMIFNGPDYEVVCTEDGRYLLHMNYPPEFTEEDIKQIIREVIARMTPDPTPISLSLEIDELVMKERVKERLKERVKECVHLRMKEPVDDLLRARIRDYQMDTHPLWGFIDCYPYNSATINVVYEEENDE